MLSLFQFLIFSICFLYTRILFTQVKAEYNLGSPAEEIQHAVCNISTKEVQATANVTISRQLKGICTSNEMHARLTELETKIFQEFMTIKMLLHSLSASPSDQHNDIKYKNLEEKYDMNSINSSYQVIESSILTTTTEKYSEEQSITYHRTMEAIKRNGTIQDTELGNSLLYYWKIDDIASVISFYDTYIDSPVFYFRGQHFQIKLHPHYQGSQYVVLELSSEELVNFRHRFSILNQKNINADITSQILGSKAMLFKISNKKLSNREFVLDGSLIIKLTIPINI